VTDFKVFNTYIPMDSLLALEKIQLKPSQNSVTFYFSSLSYTQQDKLLYYYKLDGVDKYWIKAEQDLAANYTTLSPGRYTFNVKCVNMQGNESVNVTKLSITILPPFYRTWWFITLLILLVTWLIYSVYRMRINKLLAVERIRNKVARDLHDDVGSTLSTINILSSMAKTKLLTDPVKTSEYITKITDNSQYMMEAMDDIVWSIKPDNDSMQKIVARMREYASAILEPKDIEISFQVGENILDLKLNMETRRDVFLIYKEATNNIAKYAHCTKVGIQLNHENKRFIMNIRDNGTGFNVGLADSGNGLGNMQKRAEALRGTININSREGAGTEISLNIPVDF
jgi:signal transduction histidine kinase